MTELQMGISSVAAPQLGEEVGCSEGQRLVDKSYAMARSLGKYGLAPEECPKLWQLVQGLENAHAAYKAERSDKKFEAFIEAGEQFLVHHRAVVRKALERNEDTWAL